MAVLAQDYVGQTERCSIIMQDLREGCLGWRD